MNDKTLFWNTACYSGYSIKPYCSIQNESLHNGHYSQDRNSCHSIKPYCNIQNDSLPNGHYSQNRNSCHPERTQVFMECTETNLCGGPEHLTTTHQILRMVFLLINQLFNLFKLIILQVDPWQTRCPCHEVRGQLSYGCSCSLKKNSSIHSERTAYNAHKYLSRHGSSMAADKALQWLFLKTTLLPLFLFPKKTFNAFWENSLRYVVVTLLYFLDMILQRLFLLSEKWFDAVWENSSLACVEVTPINCLDMTLP